MYEICLEKMLTIKKVFCTHVWIISMLFHARAETAYLKLDPIFGAKTFSKMTLGIMTHSKVTLNITIKKCDAQNKGTEHSN